MHWIARHIILELIKQPQRRYSQLRPEGVEGNLFSYYLDQLLRDGLIEKGDRNYSLSAKGLQFVATMSLETGQLRKQPQVLTAVLCCNENNEWLLVRWKRQPNTGLISFPHGMVHYGRSLVEMAAVELAEKAGLVADLTQVGQVAVRVLQDDAVDRHMVVTLFEATNAAPGRRAEVRPEVAEAFWRRLEDVAPAEFVPGWYEIAQAAQNRGVAGLSGEFDVSAAVD